MIKPKTKSSKSLMKSQIKLKN